MRWTQRVAGILAALMVAGAGAQMVIAQGSTSEQSDKYTWLEDIHGDKPMEWVKAENARTAAVLEKQKPFAELEKEALSCFVMSPPTTPSQ